MTTTQPTADDAGFEPALPTEEPSSRVSSDSLGTPRSRSSRSIRSSLLKIVLILIVPILAGLVALAIGFYRSEREQISQSLFSRAHELTSALDRDLAGTIAAAQVLAESPLLTSGDFAAFHRTATNVLPLLHGYAVILMGRNDRPVLNTLRPYGTPLGSAMNSPDWHEVFDTNRPMVSNLFTGQFTGQPALTVYVPVVRDGIVKYGLGVALHLSRLQELLTSQQLPPDWAATITDASDVAIAHSRNPSLIGTHLSVQPSSFASSQRLIETQRRDGTPIFLGADRSAVSGWTVAVSIPVAELSRQPNAFLLYGGAGMLVIALAGLFLAMRESARIAAAVQNLIPAALALGRAETPLAPPSGVRETDEVAEALDRAHQLLQQRTCERDQARSAAERTLADEMFRLAVEACPSGMVMTDSDGKIIMINSETERLFGYSRDELIGQTVDILVPERLQKKHLCSRHGYAVAPECRHMGVGRDLFGRRKDGSEFRIEVGLNPFLAGRELMVLSVIVDIGQRKHNERLKDEFVATVSHELRTPLTSIAGSLGLLAGQWANKLPDSAARLLTIAHANSQRLVRLVNDILDIEKMEAGQVVFNMAKVALRPLAESAIEDNRGFAASYGVNVRLDDSSVALDVNADADRLAQVVTNLLSNAVKFSPPGGEVTLAVQRNGKSGRISVRDRGPGIPAEFKPHVFEKFAQADATNARKKGGTGLGLSIVKQIVERLGGQVNFEDASGGGTIFHVDLPLWDGRAGGEIDADADPAAPRLLFCEDDRQVAKVVRDRLRRDGFAVDFAHTVATALARAESRRYGAILVDLQLPDGDGVGLIVRLRAQPQNQGTPIIVLSGDPEQGRTDVRSPRLNVLHWLPKPISFRPLVDMLKAATRPNRACPRVLHIDDDSNVLALVAEELRPTVEVVSASSAEKALQVLATERIDLIVLDISLGQDSGIDLLPELRDVAGNVIPVIVFSNQVRQIETDEHIDDEQISSALSKMDSPLESLAAAVRDRLSLPGAQPVKEVA